MHTSAKYKGNHSKSCYHISYAPASPLSCLFPHITFEKDLRNMEQAVFQKLFKAMAWKCIGIHLLKPIRYYQNVTGKNKDMLGTLQFSSPRYSPCCLLTLVSWWRLCSTSYRWFFSNVQSCTFHWLKSQLGVWSFS